MTEFIDLCEVVAYTVRGEIGVSEAQSHFLQATRKPGQTTREYADQLLAWAEVAHPLYPTVRTTEKFIQTGSLYPQVLFNLREATLGNTNPSLEFCVLQVTKAEANLALAGNTERLFSIPGLPALSWTPDSLLVYLDLRIWTSWTTAMSIPVPLLA